eukprot:CAMPEP_0185190140 /NCGR_PEP_ID=MMETSP1140-20130426/6470_1 /TAXON_ID=298111 /ORGANISM="Pavlova sp., Strain CCMP459" /LENGTH=367 /DNA_ID=CAMNT_0027756745 /DNA_START=104 /DNA_END=1207 /DNA_ORIENTATION=-
MGERKVLNKYFGPDFDPEKIPRARKPKNEQYVVRMMLPMSVRCKACGEYMYKGRKFNSRRENVEGEDYLGIRIIRFYMNCTNCRAEFCIKTDPKNEHYVAETGVQQNYEPWRERAAEVEAEHTQRAEDDNLDAMKRLENRTKDSKLEMDILDSLDELRTMNARNNKADLEQVIKRKRQAEAEAKAQAEEARTGQSAEVDEDDEAMVHQIFGKPGKRMRRMEDDDLNYSPTAQTVLPALGLAPNPPAGASSTAGPSRPASVALKPAVVVRARVTGPAGVAVGAQGSEGVATTSAAAHTAVTPASQRQPEEASQLGWRGGGSTDGSGTAKPGAGGPPAEAASGGAVLSGLCAYGSSSGGDSEDGGEHGV